MQGHVTIIILISIVVAYAFRMAYRDNEEYSKGWYIVDALIIVQAQCLIAEQIQPYAV